MSSIEGVIGFVCERQEQHALFEKGNEKFIKFHLKIYSSKEEVNEVGDSLYTLIDGKTGGLIEAVNKCKELKVEFEPKPVLITSTLIVKEKKGELHMFVGELMDGGIAIHSDDFYTGEDMNLYGSVSVKDECLYFPSGAYIHQSEEILKLYGKDEDGKFQAK